MAPVRNSRVIFNSIPEGFPEPGKTTVYEDKKTIDLEHVALHGGFIVKTLVLSIDPYMRGRMRPADIQSYVVSRPFSEDLSMGNLSPIFLQPAFTIGEPLVGHGVGVVVRSENSKVKKGDHVYGMLTHEEYSIHSDLDSEGLIILTNTHNLPWSAYVGVAGMPGKTAWMAWKEFSHAKKGETAFVTAGGEQQARLVIQLAKLDGLKVIASAGSEEKVKFMKSLGADVVFNYKTTETADVLKKEGPIDIFWDNVGGETLEAALDAAAVNARFIVGVLYRILYNIMRIIERSISMNGFIIFRMEQKFNDAFYATIPDKVAKGELKYTEEVTDGLQKVGDVLLAVQKGENKAKAVVRVAEK
ncbi:hypothetical protein H0H92_007289 [Tricholoma furcatifolium]|nr:hypothetical protein H0H92_007289 [Tricholoma furcatifolium]